jgi:hypothetical protein
MTTPRLQVYLQQLRRELRKRGLPDARIVDEAREHLVDAIEDGLRRGLSIDAAQHEAFVRFGPPDTVAARFATERSGMSNWLRLMVIRIAGVTRRDQPQGAVHYHDVAVPSRHHFALRVRRHYRRRFLRMSADDSSLVAARKKRIPDVGAFETDPHERLAQFLRDFGRRAFGAGGTLESLTLLEDTTSSNVRGGRYLAAFAGGAQMIWTIALSADGGVSFDGTNVPV